MPAAVHTLYPACPFPTLPPNPREAANPLGHPLAPPHPPISQAFQFRPHLIPCCSRIFRSADRRTRAAFFRFVLRLSWPSPTAAPVRMLAMERVPLPLADGRPGISSQGSAQPLCCTWALLGESWTIAQTSSPQEAKQYTPGKFPLASHAPRKFSNSQRVYARASRAARKSPALKRINTPFIAAS